MLTKEEYQESLSIKKAWKEKVKLDEYRLKFHLMPPTGWLNDPNGLCEFHGINHIYFQYSPFTPTWGMKLWGHYTSKDWIHYDEEEPFLFADSKGDKDGVYSGSAYVEKDRIHFFYTGNVKYTDKEYTYISDGREQNTIQVLSEDGFTHQEKKLVLSANDYPSDMSCHVRDPKIYKRDGVYYMLLGARTLNERGCVILYRSSDLTNWQYHMRIESSTPFGYMWECPDLFDIDGTTYLLCCPQGILQKGIDYANVYQCGYFEIDIDLELKKYHLSDFVELDRGFDMYAPQTFEDEDGRRILIGWMGIPDADYDNQITVERGWQHALTMPRQLCSQQGKLLQKPLFEFQQLRGSKQSLYIQNEATVKVSSTYECNLHFDSCQQIEIQLKQGVSLQYQNQMLTLSLDACGCGRKKRSVRLEALTSLQIFMDTSCLEIFINEGSEVFTSRYYTNEQACIQCIGQFKAGIDVYELGTFIINDVVE